MRARNQIGRIATAGVITEFSPGGINTPIGITAGTDGNLWFANNALNSIGRITTTGTLTNFSTGITANANLQHITVGPDGNLWFTENNSNLIGRITTAGGTAPPTIVKSFDVGSIALNSSTNLFFVVGNPNSSTSLTGVGVTCWRGYKSASF